MSEKIKPPKTLSKNIRVLIIGATGMLGRTLSKYLSKFDELDVYFTSRRINLSVPTNLNNHFIFNIENVNDYENLSKIIDECQPQFIVNCAGIVKQLIQEIDPLMVTCVNSDFPHKLLKLCNKYSAHLIHISTDCVFSGKKGNYNELDKPDCNDLYGLSKLQGEIINGANSVTIRTSIIGHEIHSSRGLVEWFLSQKGSVSGYKNAIFSGLPTVELSRIIKEIIMPRKLEGLFHISSDPINKFELLHLIANQYKKNDIKILPSHDLVIDRSLDYNKFHKATGYVPKPWPDLIDFMHSFEKN